MIIAGCTFIRADREVVGDGHLWIVLCSPDIEGRVLTVNFSSSRNFWDPTCVVEEGEHRFVEVQTCVRYNYATVRNAADITRCLNEGTLISHDSVSQALLEKILDGAYTQLSTDHVEFLINQGSFDYRIRGQQPPQ